MSLIEVVVKEGRFIVPVRHVFCALALLSFSVYLVPAIADADIFMCKVDGVVTFQSEPCQEILDGKDENTESKNIVVDTDANTIDNPNESGTNLVQRARNLEKYKYQQESKHNFDSPYYYRPSNSQNYSSSSASSGGESKKSDSYACRSYQSDAKRYRNSAKNGYSSGSSNYMKDVQREIQAGINKNCY